ncbi:MAG: hypothetical protein ACR2MP_31235 [Streptosporangiaceae bacterium]
METIRALMVAKRSARAELQERDALKIVSLAAAMTTALVARGVPDPTAHLAGELGVLAFKRGYAEWSRAAVLPRTSSRSTPWRPWTNCGQRARRWADQATSSAYRA